MNNIKLFKSFTFNLFQMRKFHHTNLLNNNGSPTNFIAKMLMGSAEIKTAQKTLQISEGDVFFIPKGIRYQSFWYGNENDDITWLSFGFDYFPTKEDVSFALQKIDCNQTSIEILDKLSENITANYTSIGLLYQLLGEITPTMESDNESISPVIKNALEFMKNTEEYSFRDVAKHCNVSLSGLYGIFQKNLGKTPNEIRQGIQCKNAVHLLTTTNLSVEEISSRLHFSSSSYFRKILRKHTGKTPLAIRKEAQF